MELQFGEGAREEVLKEAFDSSEVAQMRDLERTRMRLR